MPKTMSSQIQNLKSQGAKENIKRLVILFSSLLLTLAVFSQINAAKPKPTSDVGLKKADWLYYKSSNDLSAYLGKKSSNLPTVRYQKGGDYLEFSMTGVSSTTAVSLETNTKTPNTPTLFYRNILDGVDANYQITNIPFKIKEEIILQSKISNLKSKNYNEKPNTQSQTPLVPLVRGRSDSSPDKGRLGGVVSSKPTTYNLQPTTFLFSAETTGKPVKQKDGSIAFFDNQNNYLFQLDKPFMLDAKLNRSEAVTIEVISNDKVLISNKISSPNNQFLKQFKKFFPAWDLKNWNLFRNYDLEIRNLEPKQYQIILQADSNWLSTATYPVVIDPTVTHNADANFTGQMNRIADNDSTTSIQLESSYPEATRDPYTVLLLHFNEANGATAGIRDYASTTRVITVNGNASTTNSVTQLGLGNSAAFDGTSDYFNVPDSEDWNYGNGDFSIDFWVRRSATGATQYIMGQAQNGVQDDFYISFTAGNAVFVSSQKVGGGTTNLTTTQTITDTSYWHHITVLRRSDRLMVYIDGVADQTTTDLTNITLLNSARTLSVGTMDNYSTGLNGYLDSLRILKGRALTPEEIKAAASRRPYAVYTSSVLDASASVQWDTLNWTEGGVATGNGEQPYNTNSLVAQWDFNDTSGTTLTASSSGSCTTSCNGTLTNFSYTASQDQATTTTGWTANNKKWGGGSLMFDGTNDYVSVGDNDGWTMGTGDFAMEAWVNRVSLADDIVIAQGEASDRGFNFWVQATGVQFGYSVTAAATTYANFSYSFATGIWYHVAVVRSGSDLKAYVNGKQIGSTYNIGSDNLRNSGGNLQIGAIYATPEYLFNGILDSIRIYKGRALSASEILSNYNAGNIEIQTRTGATSDPNDGTWEAWKPTTGETQLLSMDSDVANWKTTSDKFTKLLIHADEASGSTSLTDSSPQSHTITANGNASTTNAQSKFGNSLSLNGGADWLSLPNSTDWNLGGVGGANYTIDFWVYWKSISSVYFLHTGGGTGWIFTHDGNVFGLYGGGSWSNLISYAPTINTWTHIAIVRSGGTVTLYVGGTSLGTLTDKDMNNNGVGLTVGGSNANVLNGYMDELRISKGIARWTSNFTPPSFAHSNQEGAITRNNETTLKQEGTGSTKLTLGAPQIDGNTVALWHFEETGTTTGTTLYDETANNNDATTTGTTVVDGIFGKGRSFNGTSDYVSISPASSVGGGTNSTSVELWFYPTNTSDVTQVLFTSDGVQMDWTSNSGMNCWFNSSQLNYAVSNVALNQWHYVACVYNGSNSYIYIDGILRNSVGNTGNLPARTQYYIGNYTSGQSTYGFYGNIDEVKVSNRALSADEIAETYRMGANHHLTRQVSATDLSAQTKLAFNVAADRPGTYLEAMLGESDYANYELASSTLALSTTTVLYIKGDEIASSTSIKDSSFSGKAITATGDARTSGMGKIGNSLYFDGGGNRLTLANSTDFQYGTGNYSMDMWVYHTSLTGQQTYISDTYGGGAGVYLYKTSPAEGNKLALYYSSQIAAGGVISVNKWQHIAVSRTNGQVSLFLDGALVAGASDSTNLTEQVLVIGNSPAGSEEEIVGYMDEVRITKSTALTADQIRQAYEYGLRTHPITIDFGATLQTSDLISSATDYNFTLTATTSGLSATTSGLYLGDKIIIKENLGGTEYTAQGTVNAINTTTGAITVPSWDTGSTFPSGNGYSPNATVFKWQREYFDLTGAATTTRNAITNLTLRPTNGAEGRTIYLDDFRYNTNYLTASSSSAITSSNGRYLQYRAVFSSWDSFVSPYLSAINTLYTSTANMFPPIIGISGGGFLSF